MNHVPKPTQPLFPSPNQCLTRAATGIRQRARNQIPNQRRASSFPTFRNVNAFTKAGKIMHSFGTYFSKGRAACAPQIRAQDGLSMSNMMSEFSPHPQSRRAAWSSAASITHVTCGAILTAMKSRKIQIVGGRWEPLTGSVGLKIGPKGNCR